MGNLKTSLSLILACFTVCSCGGQNRDPASLAFYEALKSSDSPDAGIDPDKARAKTLDLFETALGSPEALVRNAAAERLIPPLLEGIVDPEPVLKKLSDPNPKAGAAGGTIGRGFLDGERSLWAASYYTLGRYGEALRDIHGVPEAGRTLWEKALFFLAELEPRKKDGQPGPAEEEAEGEYPFTGDPAKDKALVFFFGQVPGEEAAWALGEIRRGSPGFFTRREDTILEARLATARGAFGEGLGHFRTVLREGPDIFLWYPGLINDLGRCFQFTQSGGEGIDLFLKWENALRTDTGAVSPVKFLDEDIPSLRYRLLYFAGRIARERRQYGRSREIFSQALEFAPDAVQKDACIWYILDTGLTEGIPDIVPLVMSFIPRWNNDTYFNDILDRLAYRLASGKQWEIFPEILARIEGGKDRVSTAKYAYITGRSIALGYAPHGGRTEADFFRLAYRAGGGALYYRALAAFFLGEPFLDLPGSTGNAAVSAGKTAFPHPREMAFLLGFFDTRVPRQALPYLEKLRDRLTVSELRRIGEAMEEAGLYADLIRHVGAYMSRDTYELERRDLELSYPRPFREPVEERSEAAGFSPELLWALVRTESAFQAEIVSRAGAVGLTQLMPSTAREMADRIKRRGGPDYTGEGEPNLRNPETNLYIGAFYLDYLRGRLEHPLLSVLAYNGGMNRVRRWYEASGSLPGDLFLETVEYRETREYGRKLVAAAAVYGFLYYRVNPEAFMADICK
ncbi:MAG: lytic transglycosylase domain-containing protein [Treponema sp.]|nr:lytic transglycosylase domain-containing protein [Treponema sp.]